MLYDPFALLNTSHLYKRQIVNVIELLNYLIKTIPYVIQITQHNARSNKLS